MRVIKPLCLGLMTRPFEQGRRFYMGTSVLCFVALGREEALFSEIGMWKLAAEELPPDQPLDLVIPKRVGEYIVAARAYAPGGRPAPAVRVSARFGPLTKSLLAVGDRYAEGGRVSQPVPFTDMALDWSRAFGGPNHALNPLGRGMEEKAVPGIGLVVPLPNIEDPAVAPEHRLRASAGFGPIDQTWPQRARLVGTHDDHWLREDFPGLARDMDWRFFNAAPADQHLQLPLTGTEDYAFENLHPEEPIIQGRLPGLAPRLFLARRDGGDAMEEVPLTLTTVVFVPHRKRAILIHHGVVQVAEEDARDVTCMLVGADRAGQPRPAEHYRRIRDLRLDPDNGVLHALRESDLAPADMIRPDPDIAAHSALMATQNLLAKNGRRDTERRLAAARAEVARHDLDPDEHGPTAMPPEEPPPSPDDLPARIDAAMAQAEAFEAEAKARSHLSDEDLAKILEGSDMTVPMIRAEMTQRPSGPPTYTAEGTRENLRNLRDEARAAGSEPSAAEIEEILSDPVMNALWERSEAELRAAYLAGAQFQDPARQLSDGQQARLREGMAARGRSLARADLCGADLAGLDLSGADLTGAWLDGANLRGANLAGAKLVDAVLAHAVLEGANLSHADASGANLGSARLGGALLDRANLQKSVLAKADLRAASLRGANIEGGDLSETKLEGAVIEGIRAPKATFLRMSLAGCRAAGANFEESTFIECDLRGADFTRAVLTAAIFLKSEVRGLVAPGADLRKAVFTGPCDLTEAMLQGANLAEANLRGAILQRAMFADAVLEGADLSDCDLREAHLVQVRAKGSRFVVADLRGASLTRGDFMSAMLSRANLRGADLTDASFYEADLARVLTDGHTRYHGMMQTRMRLRPRAEPAR